MNSEKGLMKRIVKMLIGGFICMIIAWLIFGAPLTPFRMIMMFLRTLTGG
jgi:hypothetical protein